MALIIPWEGLVLESHWDRYAKIWDICYGETQGVGPGMQVTKAECDTRLAKRVGEFDTALRKCLPGPIPDQMRGALISWSYNVGTGAACSSTLVRKANAGDLVGACNELSRWNRAGGKIVRGLTNRREAERKICLEALK
ncbi:lysozyme [Paenirhodobacter populi]|uniref:lysozyme n=1 Tax=Paenirhodobacter populi TaxID=2306993 RepID=UPI0019D46AB3|nr:lysozyme [Sinirhodobacter populi]